MSKIGIISDTHDNIKTLDELLSRFEKCGVRSLIHAGDIIAPFTLKRILARNFDFSGVFGNNDGELLVLSRIAKESGASISQQPLILEIGSIRVLVLHGIGGMVETKRFVESLAKSGDYDVIVYGHTHELDVRRIGKVLIVNPGEACGYLSGVPTAVILDIEKLEAEVIKL